MTKSTANAVSDASTSGLFFFWMAYPVEKEVSFHPMHIRQFCTNVVVANVKKTPQPIMKPVGSRRRIRSRRGHAISRCYWTYVLIKSTG